MIPLTKEDRAIQRHERRSWKEMINRMHRKGAIVEQNEASESLINIVNDEGVNVTSDPVGPLVE